MIGVRHQLDDHVHQPTCVWCGEKFPTNGRVMTPHAGQLVETPQGLRPAAEQDASLPRCIDTGR